MAESPVHAVGSAPFDGIRRHRRLIAGPIMLLADASAAFAPVIGMVAGVAANHERLKQRMDALEKRLEQAEGRGGVNRAG